jgi:hypothetical protein
MAKLTPKQYAAKVKKAFNKINEPSQMRWLGNETIKVIKHRTRGMGKGVKRPFGNRRTLKPVTLGYSRWRRKQKRHPDAAKGRKSNLTFSGEMLDKLVVIKAQKKNLIIGWKDRKNAAKAEHQAEAGRPFLNLAKPEVNYLLKELDALLERQLKKI